MSKKIIIPNGFERKCITVNLGAADSWAWKPPKDLRPRKKYKLVPIHGMARIKYPGGDV